MAGCSMTKPPDFYVNQGLSLDCVPAAIAMAVNNNYNLISMGKVNVEDIKNTTGNSKAFWSWEDAKEGLEAFDFEVLEDEAFNGSGQAIVFTTVATGIGHAVYVKDNVVYDPLGIFGKKVYSYDELFPKIKSVKFAKFSSNAGIAPRLLHN